MSEWVSDNRAIRARIAARARTMQRLLHYVRAAVALAPLPLPSSFAGSGRAIRQINQESWLASDVLQQALFTMPIPEAARRIVATAAILSLLWPSVGAVVVAQGATATVRDPAANIDGGWPRAYKTASGAEMIVYQPQIASWDGRAHMVAYSAVAYQVKWATKPSLGTVKLEANTSVWVDDRLVRFSPVKVTETSFRELSKEQLQDIVAQLDSGIPEYDRLIALDRVLANLDKSQIIPKNLEGIKADPPAIFYSTRRAILLNLDGDPVWSPIANNDLKFAVNTNWDLFSYEPTKTYFLRNERAWLKATDVKGPWTATTELPDSFKKLPADDNWKDVRAALSPAVAATPQVYVSTKPAELIRITGGPTYVPVAGTKLLWVSNTESDVFRLGQSGSVYYLVAGRWFSAPGF